MSMQDEFKAIIDNYYNGLYLGDQELIGKAFHPEARLEGLMEGRFFAGMTREEFCKFVTPMPHPADTNDPKDIRFEVLDQTGAQAVLKVTDFIFGVWFTDYLSLLRTNDGWRVVNKTYYSDKLPKAPAAAAKLLGG
jgi:hypothetical protein